jgi:riboflavin synthase
MFTGIIEELGSVEKIVKKGATLTLTIHADAVLKDVKEGDSIAVSGVCLTVVDFDNDSFTAEVSPETLKKSYLDELRKGDRVNLERSLKIGDRLMGHMVSGHIDGIGRIVKKEQKGDFVDITLQTKKELMKYIVTKGSIAIDGVSLTVVSCKGDTFGISIIPHTAKMTTIGIKDRGDSVNLECDLIGKYVESFVSRENSSSKEISRDFLKEYGFM